MVTGTVVILLIIGIVMMQKGGKNKNRDGDKNVVENFSDDTFALSNLTQDDADMIMGRYYDNNDIVENFPQATPMNVMYSDANGNLATTTDLGLAYLTLTGNIKSEGSILSNKNLQTNRNRLCFAVDDVSHSIYNNNLNIDGEGPWDGMKMNTYKGLDVRTGNASGAVPSTILSVRDDGISVKGSVKIGNVTLADAGDGTLRISNGNGYVDVGAKNGGWGHIYTDRAKFAFDKPLTAVQGSPYQEYATYTSESSKKLQDGNNVLIPTGMIMMWNGQVANIPAGWALCDGGNGTPDLRDRFIVGAGSSYGVGDTGGEASHKLIIDEMPRHSHKSATNTNVIAGNGWASGFAGGGSNGIDTGGVTTRFNDLITDQGGSLPHENRPPYYALCYIMKK
jgi:microcystin-dependent protein